MFGALSTQITCWLTDESIFNFSLQENLMIWYQPCVQEICSAMILQKWRGIENVSQQLYIHQGRELIHNGWPKHSGRIPFTCSRTVCCVLEHCSGMLERNTVFQYSFTVLFSLEYFRNTVLSHWNTIHLSAILNHMVILLAGCATPRFI